MGDGVLVPDEAGISLSVGGGRAYQRGLSRAMARISRSVMRLLVRDRWCTGGELRRVTPRGQFDLMCLLADGGVFSVQVPASPKWSKLKQDGTRLSFYHLTTPGVRQIMDFGDRSVRVLDAMSLPSPLMRELIQRLNEPQTENVSTRDRKASFPAQRCEQGYMDVLEAAMPVIRQLERAGLSAMCARPDEGFLYPCRWTPGGNPRLLSQAFVFDLRFTAAIRRSMAPGMLRGTSVTPALAYCNAANGCTISIRWDDAIMTIPSVAQVFVDPKTFKLAPFPTNEEVMKNTSKTILDCALEDQTAAPFIGGEAVKFRLFSDTAE